MKARENFKRKKRITRKMCAMRKADFSFGFMGWGGILDAADKILAHPDGDIFKQAAAAAMVYALGRIFKGRVS